jgi:glycosidase
MSCGITPQVGADFVTSEADKKQLDLILHFDHIELDCHNGDKWLLREWKLSELTERVSSWQTHMTATGGWDTIWMENHDQPRGLSRFCNGGKQRREHAAKVLALWLFSLRGTVIMFQGQELGMTNPEQFSEDMCRDIETRIFWNKTQLAFRAKGEKHKIELAKKAITSKGRDASRIPIPV